MESKSVPEFYQLFTLLTNLRKYKKLIVLLQFGIALQIFSFSGWIHFSQMKYLWAIKISKPKIVCSTEICNLFCMV